MSDTPTAWTSCAGCGSLLYVRRLRRNLQVCPDCKHQHRLTAAERIALLTDPASFVPFGFTAHSVDVLGFVDSRPYPQRLAAAHHDTGLDDAVVCGTATFSGQPAVLAVMDFRFMGGSLGAAVGEMVTRSAETALDRRLPLLIVTASGGARMQEGPVALMQMVKTSQAIARLREAGLLSVSLITDPTYGGVAASYATNCDILIAEPGARLGFAGPRVIRDTIRQELPPGFQTAEFLLAHGQLDMVVDRFALGRCIGLLLSVAAKPLSAATTEPPSASMLLPGLDSLPQRDPWEVVGLARNTARPTTTDYLERAFDAFIELHGDRLHGDCPSIVAGFARLGEGWVMVVGHQKGHTTNELVARNFGMPRPEGYRKALRVMRLADQLGLPVVTLVDTPGAYPGIEAEERGQALAIAQSVQEMARLGTPVVAVITGEGGSGGALALAVADRVLLLQNATYSVITPEGCSAILWRGPQEAPEAARALGMTAPDLMRLGIVDAVVREPAGGAHNDPAEAADLLRAALQQTLSELVGQAPAALVEARHARFRGFGADVHSPAIATPVGPMTARNETPDVAEPVTAAGWAA